MTAKGLFWMFLGPALWTAILLLIASDTAHGVMEMAEFSAETGIRKVAAVPDRTLRVDALAAPKAEAKCGNRRAPTRPERRPRSAAIGRSTRFNWIRIQLEVQSQAAPATAPCPPGSSRWRPRQTWTAPGTPRREPGSARYHPRWRSFGP